MSQRSLTGYDNRDAVTGELDQEVFRYDAAADELVCASCDPSGAAPVGLEGEDHFKALYDPHGLWEGRALAATLPQATGLSIGSAANYRFRAVHDNGRVFFNAADSLVPADSNGTWDVYQYEPTAARALPPTTPAPLPRAAPPPRAHPAAASRCSPRAPTTASRPSSTRAKAATTSSSSPARSSR